MGTTSSAHEPLTRKTRQPLRPGSWTVDPEASTVAFSIRHLAAKVRGSFSDFDGKLEIDDDGRAQGRGRVRVASIDTGMEARDRHLLAPSCFDAERHPTIDFEAALDGRAADFCLVGGLTIMGRTQPVTLSGDVVAGSDDLLSARFDATVSRRDFGIEWGDLLDGGLPVVGDRILISLDLSLARSG